MKEENEFSVPVASLYEMDSNVDTLNANIVSTYDHNVVVDEAASFLRTSYSSPNNGSPSVVSMNLRTKSELMNYNNIDPQAILVDRIKTLELNLAKMIKIEADNSRLLKKFKLMNDDMSDVFNSLTNIEKEMSLLAQYGRRENIEILNIPTKYNNNLEAKVIEILSGIGVDVSSYDIITVHRLKRNSTSQYPSSIVRFINRESAYNSIKNRNVLKESEDREIKKMFIVENLCPLYKELFDKCKQLKDAGKISNTWSHNGIVYFKKSDNRHEKPKYLKHWNDLTYYFGDDITSDDDCSSDSE